MKKTIVGSILGGLIIFFWQFLSFALINFHKPAQSYTDKQNTIMAAIESSGLQEGGYIMPAVPEGSSMEEHDKAMKEMEGKPWASVQYHSSWENDMGINMVRGLLVNIIMVFMLIWIIRRLAIQKFGTIVTASLFVGLIAFFNQAYTHHIWYDTFDVWAHFLDAIVSWGLTGLVLGLLFRNRINENTRFKAA